jgi:hypothetical protein
MKSTHKRITATLAALLLLAACDEKGVGKFADTSLHVQRGIERGIPVARALRESGAVTAEHNLRLARKARKVNSIHASAIDVALSSDPDGGNLYDLIQSLLKEAEDLRADGTVKVGDAKQVIFDLGVELAKGELAAFADSLKNKRGVKIPVSPEAREKLERAKAASDRNAKTLDEAVRLLGSLPE